MRLLPIGVYAPLNLKAARQGHAGPAARDGHAPRQRQGHAHPGRGGRRPAHLEPEVRGDVEQVPALVVAARRGRARRSGESPPGPRPPRRGAERDGRPDVARGLLAPATVALIGASGTPGKWGYMMMRTLLDGGFGGTDRRRQRPGRRGPRPPRVSDSGRSPVGPRRRAGHRRPRGLRRGGRGAGRAGVPARDPLRGRLRRALGADGARLQDRMVAAARATGMRLLGPNCMSLFVARSRLNLTGIPDLRPGTARLRVPERQPGLRPRRAWAPERARAVALPEPRQPGRPGLRGRAGRGPRGSRHRARWRSTSRPSGRAEAGPSSRPLHRLARAKPVVALIGGRTDSGRRASASHTASLLSDVRELRGLLRQAGAIEVTRLDELFPVADALAEVPAPARADGRPLRRRGRPCDRRERRAGGPRDRAPAAGAGDAAGAPGDLPADGVGPEPDRLDRRLRPELLGLPGRGATPPRRPRDRRPDPVRPLRRLSDGPRDPGQQLPGRRRRPRRAPAGDGQADPPPLDLRAPAPGGVRRAARRGRAPVRVARGRRRRVPRARRPRSRPRAAAGAARRRGRPARAARRARPDRGAPGPPRARGLGLAREPRASPLDPGAGPGRPRTPSPSAPPSRGPWPSSWSPPPSSTSPTWAACGSTWTAPRRVRAAFADLQAVAATHRADFGGVLVVPMAGPGVDVALGVARSELGGAHAARRLGRHARRGARRRERPPRPPHRRRCGRDARRDTRLRASSPARAACPRPRSPRCTTSWSAWRRDAPARCSLEAVDLNPVRVGADGVRILDARVLLAS